jgi:uncharacterized protein
MNRRTALLAPWLLGAAHVQVADVELLATAWRVGNSRTDPEADLNSGHEVGVLRLNWLDRRIDVIAALPVPSRAHGLLALPDGGFVALANRPGRWLLRADAAGRVMQMKSVADEQPARTLNGHAVLGGGGGSGGWLFTSETDNQSGSGWVSVRDLRSLVRVAQFESQGIDPHQLVWRADDDTLLVANGGIARDALGAKRIGEAVVSGLVQLDPHTGKLLQLWQLPDPWLSVRHLAWGTGAQPLLGMALQAEHPAPAARLQAPALAAWNGAHLQLPATPLGGYAGDICAGPDGGFVVSAQKQGRCWWWRPDHPDAFSLVAEVTDPCALVGGSGGSTVHMGAGRGLARWHQAGAASSGADMLAWPAPMAPDNHAVRLVTG